MRNGSIAAAAVVALIIAFAPVTAAATTSHATLTKVTGPWTGATSSRSTSMSASGCAAATIGANPAFHWMTGETTMDLAARSSNCNPAFGASAYVDGSEYAMVPLTIPAGTTVVTAHWNVRATVSASLAPTSCTLSSGGSGVNATYSYCEAFGGAYLSGYVYLWDTTSGAAYYPTSYWQGPSASASLYDFCYGGNCSTSFTGSSHMTVMSGFSFHIHVAGANTSDSFVLVTSVYGTAYAEDYVYDATMTGGAAHASVDLMGPQNGVKLAWVGFL